MSIQSSRYRISQLNQVSSSITEIPFAAIALLTGPESNLQRSHRKKKIQFAHTVQPIDFAAEGGSSLS